MMSAIEQRIKRLEVFLTPSPSKENDVFPSFIFTSPVLVSLAFKAREFLTKHPGEDLPQELTNTWNEEISKVNHELQA
jgi:hypothetical protein